MLLKRKNGKPERISHFLITMNSNKVPKSKKHFLDLENCFDQFIYRYFNYSNNVGNFPKTSIEEVKNNLESILTFIDDDGDISDINRMEISYAVERGGKLKGGRVHMHAHLKIWHFGKIQLNIPELKEGAIYFLRQCGIESIYINVKGFSDVQRNLQIYLEKEQINRKEISNVQRKFRII
jgi:hypothetical protein